LLACRNLKTSIHLRFWPVQRSDSCGKRPWFARWDSISRVGDAPRHEGEETRRREFDTACPRKKRTKVIYHFGDKITLITLQQYQCWSRQDVCSATGSNQTRDGGIGTHISVTFGHRGVTEKDRCTVVRLGPRLFCGRDAVTSISALGPPNHTVRFQHQRRSVSGASSNTSSGSVPL
jgi:hypothetical protein